MAKSSEQRPIPKMEDVLDNVGFEWRGDEQLYRVLYHLWTITAFSERSVRVLLNGPTGTGKELLANAIHQFVRGDPDALFVVNCANLDPESADADLFGAKRGAYTGLALDRMGYFQMAANRDATLVLDEVHMLHPGVRVKLYRALHEQKFTRVGDPSIPLQFCGSVVAAASNSLDTMIDDGSFPEDLHSRLAQSCEVRLPPLDQRNVEHRRKVIAYGFKHWLRSGIERDQAIDDALLEINFPGNIRGLRSLIEQLAAYASRDRYLEQNDKPVQVTVKNFNDVKQNDRWLNIHEQQASPSIEEGKSSTSMNLLDVEKSHILKTLVGCAWNKTRAAEALGLQRSTLDRKLKRYKILRSVDAE